MRHLTQLTFTVSRFVVFS